MLGIPQRLRRFLRERKARRAAPPRPVRHLREREEVGATVMVVESLDQADQRIRGERCSCGGTFERVPDALQLRHTGSDGRAITVLRVRCTSCRAPQFLSFDAPCGRVRAERGAPVTAVSDTKKASPGGSCGFLLAMRTHQASRTAVKVGRFMAVLARQPQLAPLLPKGAAESMERLMLHTGLLKPWMLRLYAAPWYVGLMTSIERGTVPGQVLCVGLRKRFMDDETRAALAEGKRQVLVVGAGLDTLCWRLASEYPDVTFIELDHPASQAMKRRGTGGHGTAAAQPAPGGRGPGPHAPGGGALPSHCLAEGGAERRHRRGRADVPGGGARLGLPGGAAPEHRTWEPAAVHLLPLGSEWAADRGDGDTAVHLHGRSGSRASHSSGSCGTGELGPLLARHGFRQDASPERVDLHRRYLVPAGLPEVPVSQFEFPVVADRE